VDACNRFEIMIFETSEEYLAKKAKKKKEAEEATVKMIK